MNEQLYTIESSDVLSIPDEVQQQATHSLESGQVIYFPSYAFALDPDESAVFSEAILDTKHKNISYDYRREHLAGVASASLSPLVKAMMHRFAEFSDQLVRTLLPHYNDTMRWGRTSYRPAEIKGRKTSKRKDDTRLHVDSFSATPVHGLRILRVFSNINPNGMPRVWHLGEPFSAVLDKFAPRMTPYRPLRASVLKWIKATKTLRGAYDHYMLQLHDRMKLDDQYQANLEKHRVDFPPQSTWLVFTDQVSHAALSGQFLLEQTFYVPVEAMAYPDYAPLNQWKTRLPGQLLTSTL